MKILIIANYAPDAQESMARYANWLALALVTTGHEVKVIRPTPVFGKLVYKKYSTVGKWLSYFDKFILFSLRLRRLARQYDLVHICDHGNAMYVPILRGVPHLVTCHDLLAVRSAQGDIPSQKVSITGKIFQHLILSGLCQAQQVVCVSEATLNDLQSLATKLRCRPVLIENPLNWPYRPMERLRAMALIRQKLPMFDGPYLFHVGGNQWYKNRAGVVRIFAELKASVPTFASYKLILAGKPITNEIRCELNSGIECDVHCIYGPDNETLQALYSASDALLFPSLAEGFGWPIAEAQACGTLVITSNFAPMSQIAGAGSILVDPTDHVAAAAVIAGAWAQRESLRAIGAANAARFAPEMAFRDYMRIYDTLGSR